MLHLIFVVDKSNICMMQWLKELSLVGIEATSCVPRNDIYGGFAIGQSVRWPALVGLRHSFFAPAGGAMPRALRWGLEVVLVYLIHRIVS